MLRPPAPEDSMNAAPTAANAEPALPGSLLAGRNLPLLVLACLASIYTLRWASVVCIPLLVGLLFSYALSPIVGWLQQRGVAWRVRSAQHCWL